MQQLKRFLKDETGAVTVDWVVLTAGVVAISMLLWPLINNAVGDLANGIGQEVRNAAAMMQ